MVGLGKRQSSLMVITMRTTTHPPPSNNRVRANIVCEVCVWFGPVRTRSTLARHRLFVRIQLKRLGFHSIRIWSFINASLINTLHAIPHALNVDKRKIRFSHRNE